MGERTQKENMWRRSHRLSPHGWRPPAASPAATKALARKDHDHHPRQSPVHHLPSAPPRHHYCRRSSVFRPAPAPESRSSFEGPSPAKGKALTSLARGINVYLPVADDVRYFGGEESAAGNTKEWSESSCTNLLLLPGMRAY